MVFSRPSGHGRSLHLAGPLVLCGMRRDFRLLNLEGKQYHSEGKMHDSHPHSEHTTDNGQHNWYLPYLCLVGRFAFVAVSSLKVPGGLAVMLKLSSAAFSTRKVDRLFGPAR